MTKAWSGGSSTAFNRYAEAAGSHRDNRPGSLPSLPSPEGTKVGIVLQDWMGQGVGAVALHDLSSSSSTWWCYVPDQELRLGNGCSSRQRVGVVMLRLDARLGDASELQQNQNCLTKQPLPSLKMPERSGDADCSWQMRAPPSSSRAARGRSRHPRRCKESGGLVLVG